MSDFFIAVGGTGQMAALAYLRLARLCGFKHADIYLMDCDDAGPISKELRGMLGTQSIPTIRPIPVRAHLRHFRDIFADPRYQDNIDPVLSILFTEDELNTPVDQGMYGRPPVGASALKAKMLEMTANPAADPVLTGLINALGVGAHRVAVAGSTLGGTGAGGVPTLAQHIRQNAAPGVKITIVDLVKWFALEPDQGYARDGVLIEDQRLQTNAESGVFYLGDKIAGSVDACVLLGLPDQVKMDYKPAGKQTDVHNFINLLSAILINNSFTAAYGVLFPTPNATYGYAVPNGGLTPGGLAATMLDKGSIIAATMDNILKMAHATTMFLLCFERYLQGGLPGLSFIPYLDVPVMLRVAIALLSKANNENEKDTCERLISKSSEKRSELKSCVEWFEGLYFQDIFEFQNADITINTSRYRKAEDHPMPFLRKWLNGINISNWMAGINPGNPPDTNTSRFVDALIKGLRQEINKTFLNNHFGTMQWLN